MQLLVELTSFEMLLVDVVIVRAKFGGSAIGRHDVVGSRSTAILRCQLDIMRGTTTSSHTLLDLDFLVLLLLRPDPSQPGGIAAKDGGH